MLNISCSVLERVRKNHASCAELLSEGAKIQSGGTFGMFAHWQETAKRFHLGELDVNQAVKALQSSFRRFDDNKRNQEKQARLTDQLLTYARRHRLEKLAIHETKKRIEWDIIPEVRLTGLAPWIFQKEVGYYAYFCLEKRTDWQSELKYPLLQRYMTKVIIGCPLNKLSIGVYFLETGKFEFKSFSPAEVRVAVEEVTRLFGNVYAEYSRLRAGAGK
jgi:hypothetical protein